ncbi:Ras and EF-hand domain-containing protein homolog [Elysia marginata]|uniref:Ras and EF-hand domain-containing protein homolog n=1 Tax=Elysia marginata TaxID=1093978 RepID=A0AAV4IIC7_9GAST|nr:Ras and EF-hand domain-containing protein homolog [Elysia marginata]
MSTIQEQVCELYQNLHTADNPELLTQFENIVLNVIHDVRHYQLENERLEKTYQKEKDEHLKHLRRLEEEMEQQVQSVEERVRRQDGGTSLVKGQEEHLNNLKKRLEEIQHENRMLKSELTDAQTNLALTRSQMTSVKQKLEEKNHELEVENKTVEDYLNEQDKLRRQLQMLHEANKTLLDTNDNLRELLDSSPVAAQSYKRQGSTDFELGALYKSGHSNRSTGRSPRCVDPGSPSFPRKGSVMSNYVDTHPGNRPPLLAFNTGMMPRFLNESCDEDAMIEDLGDHNNFLSPDSGHSTLRDLNDVTEVNDDTELDSISIQSDLRRGRRHKRHRAANLKAPEEEEDDSHDEMESDPENLPNARETNASYRLPDRPKRSPSAGSRGSNRSQRSLNREDSVLSHSSRSSRGSSRRQLPALPSAEVSEVRIVRPTTKHLLVHDGDDDDDDDDDDDHHHHNHHHQHPHLHDKYNHHHHHHN